LVPERPRQTDVDRFDDAIVVTRTRAWIGLTACLVLVVGVVVWATTASVATTVKGPGVALTNGALAQVKSPAAGTVTSLAVSVDTRVQAGQVIGSVQPPAGSSTVPLLAPVAGQVVSIVPSVGSSVGQGELVVSLAQSTGPLEVRMFLSPSQAQQLRPGMTTLLSFPGEANVTGKVSQVGNLPVTQQELVSIVGSPALVGLLVPGSSAVPVTVEPQGRWSSSFDGFDVAQATIIVGSRHPIDYVF
jgi:multidrug efflux pump subunit AcrA (membrane-fusion protein)